MEIEALEAILMDEFKGLSGCMLLDIRFKQLSSCYWFLLSQNI